MTESQQLIAQYAENGSESAFRELVSRYVDLVYSAALRLVNGDTHLAQDVSQAVFTDLARQAKTLPAEVMLGGWLHRHACFVALTVMRTERRRLNRERQAVQMNMLHSEPNSESPRLAPILDQAINDLDEPDREAILLRFFSEREYRQIGDATGCNEDAARMRVKRALGKLEVLLKRRGITTTATALSVALFANVVQAAPPGLALSISAAALAASTSTTAIATTGTIIMTTIQKAVITAAVALLAGAGIYEARQSAQLRDQVHALQVEKDPLVEQLQRATNRLAGMQAENSRLKSNSNEMEMLRLRGEVGTLRENKRQLEQLVGGLQSASGKQKPQYSTNLVPKESWDFAGYDTPDAAFQSTIWAKSTGNEKLWLESIGDTNIVEILRSHYVQGKSEEERSKFLQDQTKGWLGLRTLNEIQLGDDTVLIQAEISYQQDGKTNSHVSIQEMKKLGDRWSVANEYN